MHSPTSWYFLLPDVGLAIELTDGVAISWDGRHVAHCTAVPHDVQPTDALFSVFFSMPSDVMAADVRSSEMLRAERHRASGPQCPLAQGERVWARWYPYACEAFWRRARGVVKEVGSTGVHIRWDGEGSMSYVSLAAAGRLLVRAGMVGQPSERGCERGLELVGRRVAVYWHYEDRVFEGVVQGCDDAGSHIVLYDDGETVTGLLGEPNGEFPFYCDL